MIGFDVPSTVEILFLFRENIIFNIEHSFPRCHSPPSNQILNTSKSDWRDFSCQRKNTSSAWMNKQFW